MNLYSVSDGICHRTVVANSQEDARMWFKKTYKPIDEVYASYICTIDEVIIK